MAWALSWSRGDRALVSGFAMSSLHPAGSTNPALVGCRRVVPSEVSPDLGLAFYARLGMCVFCLFTRTCAALLGFVEEVRDCWQRLVSAVDSGLCAEQPALTARALPLQTPLSSSRDGLVHLTALLSC